MTLSEWAEANGLNLTLIKDARTGRWQAKVEDEDPINYRSYPQDPEDVNFAMGEQAYKFTVWGTEDQQTEEEALATLLFHIRAKRNWLSTREVEITPPPPDVVIDGPGDDPSPEETDAEEAPESSTELPPFENYMCEHRCRFELGYRIFEGNAQVRVTFMSNMYSACAPEISWSKNYMNLDDATEAFREWARTELGLDASRVTF